LGPLFINFRSNLLINNENEATGGGN
jgi:hypothetical protein